MVRKVLGFKKEDPPVNEEYTELLNILRRKRVTTVFQPIVDLQTAEVYAYECLTRITGNSRFSGPEPLFEAAGRLLPHNGAGDPVPVLRHRNGPAPGNHRAPHLECVAGPFPGKRPPGGMQPIPGQSAFRPS